MSRTEIKHIPVEQYMAGFRDEPRIAGYCRECRNYGRLWTCPPLLIDADATLKKYRNAAIIACRFSLAPEERSVEAGMARLRRERVALESNLLKVENAVGGLAFGFSGECLHCKECTRASGGKCRHPELVRPALEAYGFDVQLTISSLFGYSLQWGQAGCMPAEVTLVGAIFHNEENLDKFSPLID